MSNFHENRNSLRTCDDALPNVSGVPSIVGEAETDVTIELAEGVELLDTASDQGPVLMETSSVGVESDEGMIENMELAEVPLGNEQGMYEANEGNVLSELIGNLEQSNAGREESGLVTNGLTTFGEKPSKHLEKPLPFELPAAEGDDNEAKGMYFAGSPDEKSLSELDDNTLLPACPEKTKQLICELAKSRNRGMKCTLYPQ